MEVPKLLGLKMKMESSEIIAAKTGKCAIVYYVIRWAYKVPTLSKFDNTGKLVS
jgi:hypothetical protein